MIKNPILPGFYSDPSICRVEDDFYIVNSSFSYFPGVPIFHSRDLVNWEQIGHVLDRKEQLPLTYESISGGIFAPTIRYYEGMYYMITTNMSMGCVNFVVTAANPGGPWSDMFVIQGADGIDPSLFWDEDGTCYYTGTTRFNDENGSRQGIWCSQIDMKNFQLVGERHIIGTGAQINSLSPEGPHLYKKDGFYYLLIAEGGTEHHHAITVSKSKSIFGPYENFQGNPILTHRHLGKDYKVANIGHGDMVELQDGTWYMVMLGSRLLGGSHKIMGRETFLAPVVWEDGWPIVSPGTGKIEASYPSPKLKECKCEGNNSLELCIVLDHFEKDTLGYEWNMLGTPYENFIIIEDSFLKLKLLKNSTVPWDLDNTNASIFERMKQIGKTKECVSFLGRRQQHIHFEVIVKMIFTPEKEECAGILILQNDANQIRLEVVADENNTQIIRCVKTVSTIDEENIQHFKETIMGETRIDKGDNIHILKILGNQSNYSFYCAHEEGNFETVAQEVDGGFLGSETAGGFVGAYIGMFGCGGKSEIDSMGAKEKYVSFDYFSYEGKAENE